MATQLGPGTHANAAVANFATALTTGPVDDWHEALNDLALLQFQIRKATKEAVAAARAAGLTWEQVGTGLEMSKQAAQKRFGGAR